MIKETVTMSHKELDRLQVIQESVNRHITQEQAALRIGISVRQVKRLVYRYKNEGPAGLVSRRRGKRPNNAFTVETSAFQIRSEGQGYQLRHSVVTVCESFDGKITVLYDGKTLGWEKYVDGPDPIPLDDEKSVHERVDKARIDLRSKYYVKPKADHPWQTRRTQSHEQVKPPKLPKKRADVD